MGWLVKGLALVVGLVSLTLGLWPLSVSCFGYIGYSLWSSARRGTVYVKHETRASRRSRVKIGLFKRRYVVSGILLLLAGAAFTGGGTFSPWVFLSGGLIVAASGFAGGGPGSSEVLAVPDSILLRSRWRPFSWTSLVELKFATGDMARSLSAVGSEMMMTVRSGNLSVYLPIRVRAWSAPAAESKVSERLAPVARVLSSRGVYALPLGSQEAAKSLDWSLRSADISGYGADGVASLNSTPFDVLVLTPSGHFLESAAAYVTMQNKGPGHCRMPGKGKKLENRPLLWEVLRTLAKNHSLQSADALTGFLSSMSATRGENLGDRLDGGDRTKDGKVALASLGEAEVELTPPQLRAIVRAYG